MERRGETVRRLLWSAAALIVYVGTVAVVAEIALWLSPPPPRGVGHGVTLWYTYLMLCCLGAVTLALPSRLGFVRSFGLILMASGLIAALTFPGFAETTPGYVAMFGGALALSALYLSIRAQRRGPRGPTPPRPPSQAGPRR
ncbi:hypothetical protein [Pseudooceanicola onchidii]|uniref:hypothetical protein n=1 Tax=Pseudooceanicola onchidii TaxID=2562279 RepID=UPI0010A9EDCB|nr:hypothetical protein [Pseudooceanicola onchidii]